MTTRSSLRSLPALVSAALLVTLAGCSSTGGSTTSGSTPSGGSSASSPGPTSTGPTDGSVAPPAPTQASGPVDACTLVTPAEAQAALGKPVDAGGADTQSKPGDTGCIYKSTTVDQGAFSITFSPQAENTAMSKSQFDDMQRSKGGKAVAGLGESAWFARGILTIYDHGNVLTVDIARPNTPATLNELEPVARLALGRIQ